MTRSDKMTALDRKLDKAREDIKAKKQEQQPTMNCILNDFNAAIYGNLDNLSEEQQQKIIGLLTKISYQ